MKDLIKAGRDLEKANIEARKFGIIGAYENEYQMTLESFLKFSEGRKVEKAYHSKAYKNSYAFEVDGVRFFTITNEDLE